MHTTDAQKMIRNYYKQLPANKLEKYSRNGHISGQVPSNTLTSET